MRYLSILLIGLLFSCGSQEEQTTEGEAEVEEAPTRLPYIGLHDVDYDENGKADTIYHTVPEFALPNQDSVIITQDDVANKIHIVNFFFTSCPAICPAMIEQMKRLQDNTSDIEELSFLSHTIDPERDTHAKLKEYIAERDLDTRNWHFLRGEREIVYWLGEEGYMINAMEDEYAEGGFLHSEHFVLVDRERHVRGLYTGTDPEEVDQLEEDIRKLIKEEYGN